MSLILLPQSPSDAAYDAELSLLLARGGVGHKPVPLDAAPRAEVLDAVAWCMVQGIQDNQSVSAGRGLVLLGSAEWSDPSKAPENRIAVPRSHPRMGPLKNVRLDDDGQSFVLFWVTGKTRWAWCSQCDKPFSTHREKSLRARWPETCSAECKALRTRELARERKRRERMSRES